MVSADVFASVPAVVQGSGSSGVGRGAWGPDSEEDPAGSYGHNTWTGISLIHQFSSQILLQLLPLLPPIRIRIRIKFITRYVYTYKEFALVSGGANINNLNK